jgi:hypothetical protein
MMLVWLTLGPLIGPINRGQRGYSDDIYLSDVHPRVWYGLIVQLVVVLAGGIWAIELDTKHFGRSLMITAGLGALALGCVIGVIASL